MSLRDSETMPVTFQDVASCFSDEEWKLLHEWQKELYKNVMNEIHQALIALGPVIATSVFSLRAKEKDDLCSVSNPDSKRRRSDNNSPSCQITNPDTLVRVNISEEADIWDPQETARRTDIEEVASYGYPPIHPDVLLQMQQEEEMDSRDWSGSEGSDVLVCPTKGFQAPSADVSWRKEDKSNAFLMRPPGSKGKRSTMPSSAGDPVFTIRNKPEDEIHFQEEQDLEVKSAGERISHRNLNNEDFMNTTGKMKARKASEKAKGMIFQNSIRGANIRKWPPNREEFEGEMNPEDESGFSKSSNSKLNQEILEVELSDTFTKGEINRNITACPPRSHQNWQPYLERKQSYFYEGQSTEHYRTLADHIIYQCAECMKSFSGKSQYLKHQRTHHRSYQCTVCGKSFSCKYHLIRHQTKHTGEKPYQCDECEKSFTQKGSLTIHQRIHSGERPYHCTECESSFREKKQLIGHFKKAHAS
ncbi:zinc finger protein 182-like isoform X1 [Pleurodeles waltl]|uniref:zinc finger protein 182-like isoform X1 n=1 Tax=Pleurodeles waltl TaxID=8319 RepID=UPI0037093BE8